MNNKYVAYNIILHVTLDTFHFKKIKKKKKKKKKKNIKKN